MAGTGLFGWGPPAGQELQQEGVDLTPSATVNPNLTPVTGANINTAGASPYNASQLGLMGQLQSQATGTGGPTVANQQLQSGVNANLASTLASTASSTNMGQNPGLAAKGAQTTLANTNAGAAGQAAATRAGEQVAGQQGLAGVSAAGVGQQNQEAQAQAALNQQANLQNQNLQNQNFETGTGLNAAQQLAYNQSVYGLTNASNNSSNQLANSMITSFIPSYGSPSSDETAKTDIHDVEMTMQGFLDSLSGFEDPQTMLHAADGASVAQAQPAVVGEEGPEVVVPTPMTVQSPAAGAPQDPMQSFMSNIAKIDTNEAGPEALLGGKGGGGAAKMLQASGKPAYGSTASGAANLSAGSAAQGAAVTGATAAPVAGADAAAAGGAGLGSLAMLSDERSKDHIDQLTDQNSKLTDTLRAAVGGTAGASEAQPQPSKSIFPTGSRAWNIAQGNGMVLGMPPQITTGQPTMPRVVPATPPPSDEVVMPQTLPAMAEGGEMPKDGMAVVGEEGPEVVNLPAHSTVIPNKQSQGLLQTLQGADHSYEYKDPSSPGAAPGVHFGPMAQELERDPVGRSAVTTGPDGKKMVDTPRLTMALASAAGLLNKRISGIEQGLAQLTKSRKAAR